MTQDASPPVAPPQSHRTGAAMTVEAATSSDMVAAVRRAAAGNLAVAVSSGRGSTLGTLDRTACGVLLIRTHGARAVQVDRDRQVAWIQAGARWSDVVRAAEPHGLAPVTGPAAHQHAVPSAIAAGAGPLSRAWGFAADRVLRLAIVTADGQLVQATADGPAQLFMAVRGAGASFGVVTAIEVALVPVTRIYGGSLVFRSSDAPAVLTALGQSLEGEATGLGPSGPGLSVAVGSADRRQPGPDPLRGQQGVHVRLCQSGDPRPVRTIVSALCAVAGPLVDTVRDRPSRQALAVWGGPIAPLKLRTITVHRHVAAVLAAMADHGGPASPLALEFTLLGGAMANAPAHLDAVGQRDALGLVAIGPGGPGAEHEAREAGERLLAALAPFATGGTLPGLLPHGAGTPEQTAASYGPVLIERLAAAKRVWDPQAMFRFGPDLLAAAQPARLSAVNASANSTSSRVPNPVGPLLIQRLAASD